MYRSVWIRVLATAVVLFLNRSELKGSFGLHVAGLEVQVAYAVVEEVDQALDQLRDERRRPHVGDRHHSDDVGKVTSRRELWNGCLSVPAN